MSVAVCVLKFGSSVLRSEKDLPRVGGEIYRAIRSGQKAAVVVSAYEGVTDRYIECARKDGLLPSSPAYADLVAQGEFISAHALVQHLAGLGMSADLATPRRLGLIAIGPRDDAEPSRIDHTALADVLTGHDVIVIPGFSAIGEHGGTRLLGRGGSDLTAIFLARALGAPAARLIKDVDGVYERDPAKAADARRYQTISWRDANRVSDALIQPNAIAFAEACGVDIEIASIGQGDETRIGMMTEPPVAPKPRHPLRIALAGCGTVGGGVLERLRGEPERYEACGLLVRDAGSYAGLGGDLPVVTSQDALLDTAPDILIETINGADARALHLAAFEAGADVISANKQALASDLQGLLQAGALSDRRILYSAAVGGGAPILETVSAVRARQPIVRIDAILNGTMNYLLSEVEVGTPLRAALAMAQQSGLAQADPRADLEGQDVLAKLRLVAFAAFGSTLGGLNIPIDQLERGDVAGELAIKPSTRQIARLRWNKGRIGAEIRLETVEPGSLFHDTRGEANAIRIETASGEIITARGKGAGRAPTTEAVMGDLGEIERLRQSRDK